MGNKINLDTWKTKLNPSPEESNISVISLFDFFFYEENGSIFKRADQTSMVENTINKGLRLDHDIIAFDPEMYNAEKGDLKSDVLDIHNLWFNKGFDIAIPKYDERAVRKFIKTNKTNFCNLAGSNILSKQTPKNRDIFKNVGEDTVVDDLFNEEVGYWIYDKESIQLYENVEDFTYNSICIDDMDLNRFKTSGLLDDNGAPDFGKFANLFFQSTSKALSVGEVSTGQASYSQISLYVVDTDTIFKESMSTTNRNVPHLLVCPGKTEVLKKLILKSLGVSDSLSTPSDFFTQFENYITQNNNEDDYDRNCLITALKNNYILLRCSFFADYVDPDSFNQDLTQTSNVEFGNLYVKNSAGDFFRYDRVSIEPQIGPTSSKEEVINDNHKAILTRAFMPQTSPIVDLASESIYKESIDHIELNGYKTSGTEDPAIKDTIKEKFLRLIDTADWPNTPVGSIYIDPISKESYKDLEDLYNTEDSSVSASNFKRIKNIGNPSYFDPESRKDVEDYSLEEWERLPTLIHKRGNIQIDGRLLSVTTDEIWTAIKKIILGRRPDSDSSSIDLVDEGIPFNADQVKSNDEDTRLLEITNNEFKFLYKKDEQNKKGDPIRVSIAPNDDDKESLIVEMFVNNNDSIKYTIYEAIHRLDKSVTEWDKTSDDIEEKQRSIRKFTPWKVNVRTSEDGENVPENDIETGNEWKPRKVPFSLRELEAGVLQNKYNIIALARYLKENFMVSGQLGRVYVNKMPYGSEDNVIENNSAGSLYQSHKDYNYVVDDPNTYFDINRENKIDNEVSLENSKNLGRGVIFSDGDYKGIIEYKTEQFNSRYDESIYSTGQRYHSVNGYEPSEVYMAADGTWRYIHDHVRSPILKTKY